MTSVHRKGRTGTKNIRIGSSKPYEPQTVEQKYRFQSSYSFNQLFFPTFPAPITRLSEVAGPQDKVCKLRRERNALGDPNEMFP